jgi:hypothetical protein
MTTMTTIKGEKITKFVAGYWGKVCERSNVPPGKNAAHYQLPVSKDEYDIINEFETDMDFNVAMKNTITKQREDITELNNKIELLYEITKKQQEEIKKLKKNQEQEYPDFLYG